MIKTVVKQELLTVKETAAYLSIPRPTVYYLVQRGKLPAIQIGGRWRVKKGALDKLMGTEGGLKSKIPPRLLVIDDDLGIRKLFATCFEKAGFQFLTVEDAKNVDAALQSGPFDLIFLDLQLPDAGGDEVFFEIRKRLPEIPVVIITGYPDSAMLDRILETGPITVLKKPLSLSQIHQTVRILGVQSPS